MNDPETSDQRSVVAFLSSPASFGPYTQAVERFETHGSIVFVAEERAYKLKRAVRFPYMDYSTVERRHQMCLRELAINRRMAPTLYLAVKPIVRASSGSLRFGSESESRSAVDWVVVMRRFDQDALFEQMRRSGRLTRPIMRLLAETVAAFHQTAEVAHDFGGSGSMDAIIRDNCAILRAHLNRPFERTCVESYCEKSRLFLSQVAKLLDERREHGYVRRCHGDLHLNNICLLHGRPTLFDAIEFNETFSCIDVLYDLAFLLMDLDRHGLRDFANIALNRYLELADQYTALAALPLFIGCRAAVRAHTAVAAAETISDSAAAKTFVTDANALLLQAVDALNVPQSRLIAVGGISGTGKSTLARDLAPLFGRVPGAIVLRSDVIRKQLMGVPETVRLRQDGYAPAVTERVYARIQELARICAKAGYSVVADAVFGSERDRQEIADVAREQGLSFAGLWLQAPAPVLEKRLAQRQSDASDATVEVMRSQLKSIEAPLDWFAVSASAGPSNTFAIARQILSIVPG
jgi:uncharacterized protein